MKDIISDRSKFAKLDIQEEKHLSFILNKEKRLREKGYFTKSEYLTIFPKGSKPGYHKPVEDICPSFRPILSAISTSTYDLAKFLVPILKPLTENEYTVHNSFSFSSKASKLNSKNLMASLDVESLFINIPLKETIYNIINNLFYTTNKIHNFERKELKQILTFATYEAFFLFDGQYYTEIDDVAMRSPLGPTFANAFFVSF